MAGVVRTSGYLPGNTSMRVEGGTSRLAEALAASLPPSQVHLNAALTSVHLEEQGVRLTFSGEPVQASYYSSLWLALPPRLIAGIQFTPGLLQPELQQLMAVPTWMAAHAKYVARYAKPFWRDA